MRRRGRHGRPGGLVVTLVSALVATTVVAVPAGLAAAIEPPPGWVADLEEAGPAEVGSTSPAPDPEPAELGRSVGTDQLPEPEFPAAATWDVTLGGEGEAATPAATGRAAEAAPSQDAVAVAAGRDGFDGDRLRVEVHDRAAARRAGVSGYVFEVADAPGPAGDRPLAAAATAGEDLPAELTLDYSGFATAYGAGYAGRLRVVALPDCALAEPRPEGCPVGGRPLPTTNDREAEELRVEIDDLAGLARSGVQVPTPMGARGDAAPAPGAAASAAGPTGVLLAVTAGPTSEEGSYAATPVSIAGQWQVAPGSGDFTHTYDFDLPAPAGGTAPTVAMSYSSGTVDGLTNSSNTQAPMTGVGWSGFGGFIERRYEPCVKTHETADLCWLSQNATISLGGVSGPLMPLDAGAGRWAVQSDAGWKVERLTGAANGDGGGSEGVGEHWKVTATDGTQYFFGLGQNPDFPEATNSTATAPVFADHAGEPCFDAAQDWGVCKNQAWRWNLDRVVDPDGNVTSYFYTKHQNRYGAANGLFNGEVYDRSAELSRIDYGAHTGSAAADRLQATVRVELRRPNRCFTLADDCPAPNGANGLGFPDVPNDLICNAGQTCAHHSPSFFETTRYSHLVTKVRVGSVFEDVARYNLYHSFLPEQPAPGDPQKLYLRAIQEVGLTDPGQPFGFPMPDTTFEYTWLPNRVDLDAGRGQVPMPHGRISKVTNQLGGVVGVTYGQNRPCAPTYRPALWTSNDRDCFPQTTHDESTRRTGVFNKYLVTRTVERPTPTLTNPITTDYTYEHSPFWAFDNGSFAQYDQEWGWSGWRGYGTTRVTNGTSVRQIRVFRGMDGDPLWLDAGGGQFCVCGSRSVPVTSLDGSRTFTDHRALAGRVLEEASLGTLDGTPDVRLQSTLHEYEVHQTHPPAPDYLHGTQWAGVDAVTETVASSGGPPRSQRTTTTYDLSHPAAPRVVSSHEEGWTHLTGDERCTRTTYADNATRWMFEYPASNVTVAGACTSTQVVEATETYYDGSTTLGALPGRGNPTRQRTRLTASTWATTLTQFDALGRQTAVTDPNNATTTTAYQADPTHAIPTRTVVTNARGHTETTDWVPELQAPSKETDANGQVTTYRYDGLGRLLAVALPTEQQPGMLELFPSWKFTYSIDQSAGRSVVLAQQMSRFRTVPGGGEATYEDTWTIYDGLGREWQTHQRSPRSGHVLVTETAYDGRGLVLHETAPQAVEGTPGALVLVSPWANRTRHAYDALGREVRQEWYRGDAVERTTELAYTPSTVTATGPDGRRVRDTTDGLGRTTEVAEHDGSGWVASTYAYDLADNLLSIHDPEGNETTYTYDLAGRRLTQADPDRGARTFGYDAAGNPTSVVDAEGNAVHTTYDNLGRPTHRRSGSATGPLLASWSYDTLRKGLLDRTTTVAANGTWTTDVTGYDARSRATGSRVTAPAGIPGLSGVDYTIGQTYDLTDRVTSVSYPAVGGLAAETVTTAYDALGLPTGLTSPLTPYVRTTTHDDRGRLTGAALGPPTAGGGAWMARGWTYDADQRPATTETFVAGASAPNGVVARHELGYDDAGNLAQRATSLAGDEWRECYEHDDRHRLERAFTVERADTCTSGDAGTGDRPYEQRYTYAPDGRLLTRSEVVDPEPADAIDHTYPDPGDGPPHAPTAVGDDTYGWDDNGNLAERTVAGDTETFTWDVQQQLASVQGPGGTTRFTYDADGGRLLRQAPDATTLYLPGHEITANPSGSTVRAVRSYAFEGHLIATRTPTALEYVITDDAGSTEMAVAAGGQPTADRTYEPYGQVRTEDGSLATDRGYLGQVEDPTTHLSYLRNRYYDTTTGVFLSADPLYDTGEIRSLNPYTYGLANPTTMADPDGLSPVYIHGLEGQNRGLRHQNSQLRSHITRLTSHIESLQGIVRKQTRIINSLVTRIKSLETIILQQQSVIRRLVSRVNYLTRVVNAQRVVIGRLQAKVAAQARIIRYQAGVIRTQRWIIGSLLLRIPRAGGVVGGAGGSGLDRWVQGFMGWRQQQFEEFDVPGLGVDQIQTIIDRGLARGRRLDQIRGDIMGAAQGAVMDADTDVNRLMPDHYGIAFGAQEEVVRQEREGKCLVAGQLPGVGPLVDLYCYWTG
jgi:RHS repeat-associated protein